LRAGDPPAAMPYLHFATSAPAARLLGETPTVLRAPARARAAVATLAPAPPGAVRAPEARTA